MMRSSPYLRACLRAKATVEVLNPIDAAATVVRVFLRGEDAFDKEGITRFREKVNQNICAGAAANACGAQCLLEKSRR